MIQIFFQMCQKPAKAGFLSRRPKAGFWRFEILSSCPNAIFLEMTYALGPIICHLTRGLISPNSRIWDPLILWTLVNPGSDIKFLSYSYRGVTSIPTTFVSICVVD